jgi:dihydropteroate synthase
MGIINLTPDSFSGDGLAGFTQQAIEQAVAFQQAGADILDIGAFSTRPGHEGVSECEELERLIPTLDEIVDSVNIPISVDTFRASVARAALKSGVSLINDVTGLKSDPDLAKVAVDGNAGLVVMHSQDNTSYRDLVPDIIASLEMSVRKAVSLGMNKTNLILDPGIGFGKTADQSIELLGRLDEFKALGYPLMVGPSRKSSIGKVLGLPVGERVEGTAAAVSLAVAGGADIIRVHDVKQMVRVVRMSDAIVRGWRPETWTL